MMISIPGVLDAAALARCAALMDAAAWIDGNVTSGHQSRLAKRNRQLPEGSAAADEMGRMIADKLARVPLFIAAALPANVFPPLFNAYRPGDGFDLHVDNAVRVRHADSFRIRSDLSATLFLSDPDSYDGGELVVEDTYGAHPVKLAAGDMILYPASSLHRVEPITRGERRAAFFWIQSMVRDDGARAILFDLDRSVQELGGALGQKDTSVVRLTGVYHNLLRRWAEV